MPLTIKRKKYYRTAEVCQIVGISRSTFFRWLKSGVFEDVENVDRRGWRLFTVQDLKRLVTEANKVRPKTARTSVRTVSKNQPE
ncbi:MAG: helix-turn-helix transcriptional regulator [Dehalococcoidales bacterium]